MTTYDVVGCLLDHTKTLDEKKQALIAHIRLHAAGHLRLGLGVEAGLRFATATLFASLEDDEAKQLLLAQTLDAILDSPAHPSVVIDPETQRRAAELGALPRGARIIVELPEGEVVTELLDATGTRFLCRHPSGRVCNVPVSFFRRAEGQPAIAELVN